MTKKSFDFAKIDLNKIHGGQDPGHTTENCIGTTYWAGYGIGMRSDEVKKGDWYPAC